MELQPLKIHFYPKIAERETGACRLYMRLGISGQRADISLKYDLTKDDWDDKMQMLKPSNPNRGYVLNLTNKYRQLSMEVYQQLIQRGMPLDVNIIRLKITGNDKGNTSVEPTLMSLFKQITERKKLLKGRNNTKATIQKYGRCKNHLEIFIKKNYNKEDIKFSQLNLQFVEDFELYLKTDGKCGHNAAMKYIQIFKTIYKSAQAHGYTDKDPFQKFKIRMEEVVRDYLSEKEIDALINLSIPHEGLTNARDLFLFSCFTGLAYIDLRNLSVRNIQFENGRFWIRTRRQKTNVKTNVPLLELPMNLIKKRCPNFETMDADEKIFRVITNQKINEHLKELAKLAEIKKILTFHIARHTFATTITLNNGVPIESVSSMLGHKHITTTQHYAKLLDKKLEADMDVLAGKLNF